MAGSITVNWTDPQEVRLLKILEVYPIPLTDPDDPLSPPLHTLKQWFKILITRYIKSLVQHAEREVAEQVARDGVSEDEVMT